jgi:hypothetical protein
VHPIGGDTGVGDRGEPDARGPWNQGDDIEFVEAPAFKEFVSAEKGTRNIAMAGLRTRSLGFGALRNKRSKTDDERSKVHWMSPARLPVDFFLEASFPDLTI